jgi:hypothetical protein
MRKRLLLTALLLTVFGCSGPPPGNSGDVFAELNSYEHLPGYYDLYWDEKKGRLLINADKLGEPFIYQASLARGVGSNETQPRLPGAER